VTRKKAIVIVAALVAGVLVAGASAVGVLRYGSPTGAKYGAWAPGNSGSVGAMARLPAPANVPDDVVAATRHMASVTGGDPAVAVASLRKLRTGLGVTDSDFYAFHPTAGGAACYFITGRGGVCPTAATSNVRGIEWSFGGGYPGNIDGRPQVPGSIDGLVADNVRSVTLTSNGVEIPLEIVNNAFYKEIAEPPSGTPWSLELRITYANRSEKAIPVPDPRGD